MVSGWYRVKKETLNDDSAYLSRVVMRPVVLTSISASTVTSSLFMNKKNASAIDSSDMNIIAKRIPVDQISHHPKNGP